MKQCADLKNTYFKAIEHYEKVDLDLFADLLALCVQTFR